MWAIWQWLAPWLLFAGASLWQVLDFAVRLVLLGALARRWWREDVQPVKETT
jgi:hypothetical protein